MSVSTGITTIQNSSPEVPIQASEFFLSTPQFNLIHSFGAQKHYAKAFLGKTYRMSRFAPLDTEGGQLDGSGIDPAPEVPIRTDVDADMQIYAKAILVNEQVRYFDLYKFSLIDLETPKGDRAQAKAA